jgi:hypothetical protein
MPPPGNTQYSKSGETYELFNKQIKQRRCTVPDSRLNRIQLFVRYGLNPNMIHQECYNERSKENERYAADHYHCG